MKRRFEKIPLNRTTSTSKSLLKTFDPLQISAKMLHSFRGVRLSSHTNNTFELSSSFSSCTSTTTKRTKSSNSNEAGTTPTNGKNLSPKKRNHSQQRQQQNGSKKSTLSTDLGLKSVVVQRKLNSQTNYSLRAVRKKITASNELVVEQDEGVAKAKPPNENRYKSAAKDENKNDAFGEDNDGDENNYDDGEDEHGIWLNWRAKKRDDQSNKLGGGQSSQIGTKRGSAQARLMMTTKSRKVRYGWYDKGAPDEFKMAREGDPDFKFTDPDERICFNERKAWAGDFVICVGQTNLCKWL